MFLYVDFRDDLVDLETGVRAVVHLHAWRHRQAVVYCRLVCPILETTPPVYVWSDTVNTELGKT